MPMKNANLAEVGQWLVRRAEQAEREGDSRLTIQLVDIAYLVLGLKYKDAACFISDEVDHQAAA